MTKFDSNVIGPTEDIYKALVLTDNSEHMEAIKKACEFLGQEVICVDSSRDCIQFLKGDDVIDILIAEAFIEDASVFDVLKVLKSERADEDIRMMILALEPDHVGEVAIRAVERAAEVFGVSRFVYMPILRELRLRREINLVIPDDRPPRK